MKLSIALVLAGLFTVSMAHARKSHKPTICFDFTEMTATVDGTDQKVVVCQDGAKPVVLTTYSFATLTDPDGKSAKAAIGYR